MKETERTMKGPGRTHTRLITDPESKGYLKAVRQTGGWFPSSKRWLPIRYAELMRASRNGLYAVLDFLAAAIEEGALTEDNIYQSAFTEPTDWETFIADFHHYPFWINERWFHALSHVKVIWDEGACFDDISDDMLEWLEEWRAKPREVQAVSAKETKASHNRKARKRGKGKSPLP